MSPLLDHQGTLDDCVNCFSLLPQSVSVLLERRIPTWPRLVSLRAILAAASLEEIRFLAIPRSPTSTTSLHLSTNEVRRLVRALFRPSTARSALLRDLADGGGGDDGSR